VPPCPAGEMLHAEARRRRGGERQIAGRESRVAGPAGFGRQALVTPDAGLRTRGFITASFRQLHLLSLARTGARGSQVGALSSSFILFSPSPSRRGRRSPDSMRWRPPSSAGSYPCGAPGERRPTAGGGFICFGLASSFGGKGLPPSRNTLLPAHPPLCRMTYPGGPRGGGAVKSENVASDWFVRKAS